VSAIGTANEIVRRRLLRRGNNMNSKSLLLVEDNADDIELTLRALKKNNIMNEVAIARDGEEALRLLFGAGPGEGTEPPSLPSVMLLDLKLPKLDGLGVLRQVRANPRTKFLPVVVLTSSKEEQDLVQSYSLGANSYVRKPVDFHRFVEAVQQLGLYWLLLNETAHETGTDPCQND
jgi:two-component system, response regulator